MPRCPPLVLGIFLVRNVLASFSVSQSEPSLTFPSLTKPNRTLIVYHYAERYNAGPGSATTPAATARRSLDFFLRVGVAPDDARVAFVLNVFAGDVEGTSALVRDIKWTLWEAGAMHPRSRPTATPIPRPPPLPRNVVVHKLDALPTSDMCTHHATVRDLDARGELATFKRVVVLNSGVRGPLLDRHWVVVTPWNHSGSSKSSYRGHMDHTDKVSHVGLCFNFLLEPFSPIPIRYRRAGRR